jgi:hypothetical protein
MKKILLSAALMLACALPALAMPAKVAKSGIFVTGDLGYGILFNPKDNMNGAPGNTVDRNSFVWSAGLGYAWALDSFNMVGIEADYFSNGQSKYNGGTGSGTLIATSTAEAILLSYTTIWENGINLFFKAGPDYLQQKNNFSGPTNINGVIFSGSGTHTGITGMGVIGLGYYVTKNLNLFADVTGVYGNYSNSWSVAAGDTPKNIGAGASAQIKAGLTYQF